MSNKSGLTINIKELIIDGNPDIGLYVWREIGNSTCSRHLSRSTVVTNENCLHTRATCSEIQSNISNIEITGLP